MLRRLIRYPCTYKAHTCMNPTLNESSAIWCYECSDAIEICDGIIFDFYTGLYYICTCIDAQSTLSCFTLNFLSYVEELLPVHMCKSCSSLQMSGESHCLYSTHCNSTLGHHTHGDPAVTVVKDDLHKGRHHSWSSALLTEKYIGPI